MKLLNAPIYQYVEELLREEDVHDVERVSAATPHNATFVVFAIILTAIHGFILYLLLGTAIWPVLPIIAHIIVSAVVGLMTYTQYKRGMDVHHLSGLAIVSAATGIFGTVGALISFIATQIFRQKNQHFQDWYESIFPTDEVSESQIIYDGILEGIDENPTAYGVMPFIEVMNLGSEEQKRRALSKMTVRFHPRLSPAFKIALKDPSNGIRVQAATAVAKIERDFMRILERIEEARAEQPHNSKLHMALAKFYDDYAFTGILDPELERLNRQRAIDAYKSYLQQDPNNPEAWNAIGRLLFRAGQWKDAADWFKNAMDRGMKMQSTILWHLECLFRTGQFGELRRVVATYGRDLIAQEELPPHVRDAVALWARA